MTLTFRPGTCACVTASASTAAITPPNRSRTIDDHDAEERETKRDIDTSSVNPVSTTIRELPSVRAHGHEYWFRANETTAGKRGEEIAEGTVCHAPDEL